MGASAPQGPEFAIDARLAAAIDDAAGLVAEAGHLLALTGAGLSVESGIPPFRGPGGLWTKYGEPPMDGYQRFLADPAAAWRERLEPREPWMKGLRDTLAAARPNAGHQALVELEHLGCLRALVTQNIDDLHRQAGHRVVLEIHGNHRLLRCLGCHTRFDPARFPVDPEHLPPRCPDCGGLVKGDTVQFGEPIPPDVLRRCYEEVERADGMLVVGTTATVFPAAELPYEVLRRGGFVVEVNPGESDLTHAATISLRGPGGAVLTRLVERIRALQGAETERGEGG
jgi:NAD-dependent deacetylase